jgi:hypothetical protein
MPWGEYFPFGQREAHWTQLPRSVSARFLRLQMPRFRTGHPRPRRAAIGDACHSSLPTTMAITAFFRIARTVQRAHRTATLAAAVLTLASLPAYRVAGAQTDYYNTDTGRPIRIEDAYATERYSLDLHLAPLTIERARSGQYRWSVEPELAYGLVPRTQVELGVPVVWPDAGGSRLGIAGVDLSALYNFNVETQTFPAFGIRAGVLLPVGQLAPEQGHATVQGMATRTFRWARLHFNSAYTFGEAAATDEAAAELTRWATGIAADRTFVLQSFLVTAEILASEPLASQGRTEWTTGAGIRYQLTPYTSLDAGISQQLNGSERATALTFGLARVLGVRVLPPGLGRWRR